MCSEKRRTKLLFFHPTFVFGGAERTAVNIIKGIDRDAFCITLVTSRDIALHFPEDKIEKTIPIEDAGIGVWYTQTPFLDILKDSWKIARLLRETKPDVAFGMMYYASALLCLGRLFGRVRTRVIASPRGPLMPYLEMFHPTRDRGRLGVKISFRILCMMSDHIIVASEGLSNECVNVFGARRENISVIHNGIDADLVRGLAREDAGLAIPDGYAVISTAGRLAPEKNLPMLFKAVSEVRKSGPLKLIVIGDGPERGNLQGLASELGMGDDIIFVGFQENPFKFFRISDLYVHTCFLEGFGNSMVEALACGLPVIATDCPFGPREIVADGYNGKLVSMNSTKELKDAITFFIENTSERERVSANASKSADRFGVEKMVDKYIEAFTKASDKRA
ncbi:MAG TPA: glycosyltransferase [Thermodesulfovibrionales bacterium]|nr:glycosyltransferase [Thermodesulfovibrionales bacterium]